MPERPRPLALIVLDGWGIDGALPHGDATELAKTPVLHALRERYPAASLDASGEAVGLPAGVIGNSEVGHMNLGAGRVVYQDLTRISKMIREGAFAKNEELAGIFARAKERGAKAHLLGLCSDAGVHSHLDHLYALLDLARQKGLERVFVHAFTDGRDSPPTAGAGYLREIERRGGAIASVSGRYYAMDRDKRWDRTKRAFDAIVHGAAPLVESPVRALEESYAGGVTDEFVEPVAVRGEGEKARATVDPGDVVVFWNFRADRARQLTRALTQPRFAEFDRGPGFAPVDFVSFTRYDETFETPIAFAPQSLDRIFPVVLAARGLAQLRVAETEKYAHVTYFFSGGDEAALPGEERILVPSNKSVATYDLAPEMRAKEIADEAIARIVKGAPLDFICLNFANADMVGHSGRLEPTERACEAVDRSLGRLLEAIAARGGAAIVTADHGNAEQMIDPATGAPHTAHTTNPVPIVLVDEARRGRALRTGRLADVAPTLLEVMGLEKPPEMTGRSLLA
jgi:2,3-bisphosphoglycerate-independent phosphoglycerate mutase